MPLVVLGYERKDRGWAMQAATSHILELSSDGSLLKSIPVRCIEYRLPSFVVVAVCFDLFLFTTALQPIHVLRT